VLVVAIAVAAAGRDLHGRPGLAVAGVVELAVIASGCGWAGLALWRGRSGFGLLGLVSFAGAWEGVSLLPTLTHGYVLLAVPPAVGRLAAVVCLGGSVAILPPLVRRGLRAEIVAGAALACVLAGCGSASGTGAGAAGAATVSAVIPPSLVAQARPIGRGGRFHTAATGPILGRCRPSVGVRSGVHVELFAENRVVLIPAGVGVRGPLRMLDGRITAARCYGELATLDPTGVVLVRRRLKLNLGDLFRSWGEPLRRGRLAGFAAPAGSEVRVFVDGRRWGGAPGAVPLVRHSEVVAEVAPFVPPHRSFLFEPGL
jgi:hypothetical protein